MIDAASDAPVADGSTADGSTADDVQPSEPTIEALCPEKPAPRRQSGTVLELHTEFVVAGKAMRFGEPNDVGGGVTVTPSNVRLYVSEVALVQASGTLVPVDLVTADRTPVPYGVQLLTADDPSTLVLRVLAPAGDYRGVAFTFGLTDACNSGPTTRKAPLSDSSQMTWPHEVGYLFLRYESTLATPGSIAAPPVDGGSGVDGGGGDGGLAPGMIATFIHMGGHVGTRFAPVIHVDGALSLPSTGTATKRLRINMDQIYKGALTETDLSMFDGFPEEDVLAGERLRRAIPNLVVFSLAP